MEHGRKLEKRRYDRSRTARTSTVYRYKYTVLPVVPVLVLVQYRYYHVPTVQHGVGKLL